MTEERLQEIEARANIAAARQENGEPHEKCRQVNVYTCHKCGYETVTVNEDDGTTPMFLRCRRPRGCTGQASSSMYRVPQDLQPTHAWYRPVEAGGLLLRDLSKPAPSERPMPNRAQRRQRRERVEQYREEIRGEARRLADKRQDV